MLKACRWHDGSKVVMSHVVRHGAAPCWKHAFDMTASEYNTTKSEAFAVPSLVLNVTKTAGGLAHAALPPLVIPAEPSCESRDPDFFL